ncbi:MAG: GNAT family N-acetyltransferase [Gammaproteobacteria bacterium]
MTFVLRFEQKPLCDINPYLVACWEGLMLETEANISMHPNWVAAIANAKGVSDHIEVFLCWDNARLVAAIPYYTREVKQYGLPLRAIDLAGNLVCYHHEILARQDRATIVKALLSKHEDWDIFCMGNVLSQGATEMALRELREDIGSALVTRSGESSPYISIQKGWDAFLAEKSGNFRSQLKRKEKKLRQLGELKAIWFTSEEQVPQLLADILVVEKNSWKEGLGMAISNNQAEQQYYQRLLPFLAQRDWLYANVLRLNGDPVAYSLCYAFNRRVGQLKTSFDHRLREFSPGIVANKVTIQKAFDIQATEFDFLGDVMRHKIEWADEIREHRDFYLFSKRLKATLIGRIKQVIAHYKERRRSHT